MSGDTLAAPTAVAVLTHIVKSIVDHPDEVTVDEVIEDGKHRLDVRVADGTFGAVVEGQSALFPEE